MPTVIDRLIAGLARHRAGDMIHAEAAYRAVLAEEADQPLALHLLGVLTLATGRAGEAVPLLRRAVVLRADNDESRLALADACAASGAREEAITCYRALLADRPGHVGALVNLANALRDSGEYPGAIAACREVLAASPGLLQAQVTLGSALLAAGQADAAIGAYDRAVVQRPDFAPAQAGLAMALLQSGRPELAVEAASVAVRLAPRLAEAWFVQGAALRALHRYSQAIAALQRAVGLDPEHARARLALGNAYLDLDRLDIGESHLRVAIALDPGLPEAHASLGFLLAGSGRLAEAVAACDEAIRLRPEFPTAHWNRSFAHLLAGDFTPGWEDYEWRKRHERFSRDFLKLPGREWEGDTLTGQTLLVHAEQGLGDTIQFARYLPMLAGAGARVVLACAEPLMPLLARLPGVAAVVPKTGRLPAYDVWVDQMSLPRLFGTQQDSIPTPLGYLTADPARVAAWRPAVAHRPRVGVVWAGNPLHSNDARRSMPATALAPVLEVTGLDWVSLQTGPGAGAAVELGMEDLSPRLTDFAETAAVIATLDLVIAVDTSAAHLAGAMGVPVWVMLPFAPDWRWMIGRSDSPWYASMTLFRQTRPGDWDGVADRVAAAVAQQYR